MFIQCSDCNYKYLVNSADLKPKGRLVECANCNYQWFQKPSNNEELLSESIPSLKNSETEKVKNLPSTIVKEQKVSFINSFLVIIILIGLFTSFFLLRSYGVNIFVLINFYINEFFFNLKLIVNDLAFIIYKILN